MRFDPCRFGLIRVVSVDSRRNDSARVSGPTPARPFLVVGASPARPDVRVTPASTFSTDQTKTARIETTGVTVARAAASTYKDSLQLFTPGSASGAPPTLSARGCP